MNFFLPLLFSQFSSQPHEAGLKKEQQLTNTREFPPKDPSNAGIWRERERAERTGLTKVLNVEDCQDRFSRDMTNYEAVSLSVTEFPDF